ncbi:MAG: alpha-L-fucosidase [Sphingobacteriales bacterium]|nr:MAG: alpha-L-fucosidase [Sphingobacteriales bacterium]
MRHAFYLLSFLLISAVQGQQKTNPDEIRDKMKWYENAKLGIFIHWGIYAVNSTDESWAFFNRKISWTEYMQQAKGFTASRYDPEEWAELIQYSGAGYAVITTKHHDGVALWNTKAKHYDVVDNTPAKRDLLAPFYSAIRKRGIKAGAYFSLIDWSHPDYPAITRDSVRYQISNDYERWQRFRNFMHGQLKEVNDLYKPDLWWFDGDWEHSAEEWESMRIRTEILRVNPLSVLNGRLAGWGDYETPEQNIPVSQPKYPWWELCMTTNDNWGYKVTDTNWKTPFEIISIFADVVSNGGNLLLDIGPKEDGTIPAEQVNILRELGDWNKANREAIFGSRAGIPKGHFFGPTTLSADSTKLYLFVSGNSEGPLLVKGLTNKIKSIRVLGNNSALTHKVVGKISWSPVPGLVFINLPRPVQTKYITVLELSLEGPIKLYSGQGGF